MGHLHHTTPPALLRNAAVTLLHGSPEFRHVSRRLLADLIAQVEVVPVTDAAPLRATPLLLVVVQGPLTVGPLVLRRGVYWADEQPLDRVAAGAVDLRAPRGAAYVIAIDKATLLSFLHASPSLGVVQALRRHFAPEDVAEIRVELLWMAKAPSLDAPLAALTELLAAAVGLQFAEPVGVVTIAPAGMTLGVWNGVAFAPVPLAGATDLRTIAAAFSAYVGRRSAITARSGVAWRTELLRLFCVRPEDSSSPPAAFKDERFHRVIYVTDAMPAEVPHALGTLVRHDLHPTNGQTSAAGTYFSSFIVSIVVARRATPARSWLTTLLTALLPPPAGGFRAMPIDDGSAGTHVPSERRGPKRLHKDQCRLLFDLAKLAGDWRAWSAGSLSAPSFPSYVFDLRSSDTAVPPRAGAGARCRETAERWARAVTNRRVGVALSGGGACAYRAFPLIEMVRRSGVPIDLFSGVSGGALMGAYYCKNDLAGLKLACERGPAFQLVVAGATLWSGIMERQVDCDLGDTRVEDLEVLFLPVTTALGDPPAAQVVVGGTLGEAVRASGSALFAFGPTRKGALHYADGSTATMIPAKVLTDYGADLVLACNCIPGPKHGNPLGAYRLGRFAYNCVPLFGRVIDSWVGSSYLLATASRMSGTDAQVYWEPSLVDDPLIESAAFVCAYEIVRDSLAVDGDAMQDAARDLLALWNGLGR